MSKKNKKNSKAGYANPQPSNFSKRILSVLRKDPDKALNYKQIASRLGKEDPSSRNQIIKDLSRLAGKSKIDPVGRGKFRIAGSPSYFEGVLDMTTNGNGYVIVEELQQDIFIHHKKLNHALDGDQVRVFLFGDTQKKKLEGEIVDVLHRKTTTFVGVLRLQPTFGFVEINSPKMYTDIFVPRNKVKKAKDGELVQVEIQKWPKRADSPEGHIIKVLGTPGEHETTMQAILAESGLANGEFPAAVEAYANNLETRILAQEIEKRRDFRDVPTFTIDPKDSKDFDDALSFTVLKNGNYQVGVHIADVSHYVQPGSILDQEAFERGNSIYLVDRTIPMLPEILSNKACSLRPGETKYTFSAVFELTPQAEVKQQWFGKTLIQSDRRFSYEEAQYIIDSESGEISSEISKTNASSAEEIYSQALLKLNALARKLRTNRISSGAITFDSTEVRFKLDENFDPVGISFQTQRQANHLIEEFMLLANRKVSEFISKQQPAKTFIYRCHDQPDGEKLVALKGLVRQFGYDLNLKNSKTTTQSLNNLLSNVSGKKEEHLVSTLAVRTMSKAYYSTKNIGHYGLAFKYYSHFTAPIRRYSDILAHRLLQHYLENQASVNAEDYEKLCKHCSEMERFAIEAERDSVKYMQVKFMQNHKGQVFKGVISGVTDFGIFVEIIENKCEGLVRLRDLSEDHFTYEPEKFAVIGQHSGKMYRLGDEVFVEVKATDLVKRNLDFRLADQ